MGIGPRISSSAVTALGSICGWLAVEGALIDWDSWAAKWYLLVVAVGAAVATVVVQLARPRTWRGLLASAAIALVYGATVVAFIGYVVVYRISGATD
jgi:hypothetical protein